jgi:hypothetical protein
MARVVFRHPMVGLNRLGSQGEAWRRYESERLGPLIPVLDDGIVLSDESDEGSSSSDAERRQRRPGEARELLESAPLPIASIRVAR